VKADIQRWISPRDSLEQRATWTLSCNTNGLNVTVFLQEQPNTQVDEVDDTNVLDGGECHSGPRDEEGQARGSGQDVKHPAYRSAETGGQTLRAASGRRACNNVCNAGTRCNGEEESGDEEGEQGHSASVGLLIQANRFSDVGASMYQRRFASLREKPKSRNTLPRTLVPWRDSASIVISNEFER
jgi:hypothetical protein